MTPQMLSRHGIMTPSHQVRVLTDSAAGAAAAAAAGAGNPTATPAEPEDGDFEDAQAEGGVDAATQAAIRVVLVALLSFIVTHPPVFLSFVNLELFRGVI